MIELAQCTHVEARKLARSPRTGQIYDSGNYARALDEVLRLADYAELRRRQRERQTAGEAVGIGFATYVEPCAAGWESGTVRVERSGTVTALSGAGTAGQGHETTLAQIVADVLCVDVVAVVVKQGDTAVTPPGFGSVGSRTTAVGGGALATAAAEVREKGRRIAARILEAADDDVRSGAGGFEVVGAPGKRVTWRQVADAAYAGRALGLGDSPGLEATSFFKGEGELWSFGAALALVSIDRETGIPLLERFVWVDDAGTIVNPMLAEGQLHGGLAQGLGQAFLEEIIYDREGQLVTGTLMDYAVPRAEDFREPALGKTVTPSPWNPLGAKGLGEAGCIAAPPAVVNAVADALAREGITASIQMPLTAEKLWRLLRGARSTSGT
jgi:carbon-monoxide dehydrogenase large subunit